jgi:hypothetical protein
MFITVATVRDIEWNIIHVIFDDVRYLMDRLVNDRGLI